MKQILLVGNPNCGKTTLFNALTGSNQRVGNWPGVTVEKKTGHFVLGQETLNITDLPGIYSLSSLGNDLSLDEQIAAKAIVELEADLILNVIDACHLERHLYLSSQILELGKPVIVVLNMTDIAEQRGIKIDIKALAKALKSPVLPLQAHQQIGLEVLKQCIQHPPEKAIALDFELSTEIKEALIPIEKQLQILGVHSDELRYYSRRIIEGDKVLFEELLGNKIEVPAHQDFDLLFADARYQAIHQIVKTTQQKRSDASEHFTAKLDRIVLNRFLALPIFFAAMYLMFLFAINIGGAFQDFFDISTDAIFVQGSARVLQGLHCPDWLIAVLANGIGRGINTTLTFIPVIAAMFFFLSLLESSGYMARAAFVVDKSMRALGLPGKSFVPMIVGFGCNVPAIMASRTLDSQRDRILTVLMSPFMSCSARLAIYAVFVAAFFPSGGQNVVFSLYLIGILMAVLTGFILRKTSLKGKASPLILELPAYHKPALKRLLKETLLRLRHFVLRAGRLIVPISVVLGCLNSLTLNGGMTSEASSHSLLSLLGQWLTPLFSPMGIEQNNWPATVGLLTGMLAKEVVVGTLNALYAQLGDINSLTSGASFDLWASLQAAFWSIPQNLAELGQSLSNPILASAPSSNLSQSVYGIMVARFDGQAGAYAYLLFVLLYIPCLSTMVAIRQETTRKLMWFSIIWSLLIAYFSAVLFYQLATYAAHPQQSLTWVLGIVLAAGTVVVFLRFRKEFLGEMHASTNS